MLGSDALLLKTEEDLRVTTERLAKAEALLRESLQFVPGGLTSSRRLEFAARIASFLEGK